LRELSKAWRSLRRREYVDRAAWLVQSGRVGKRVAVCARGWARACRARAVFTCFVRKPAEPPPGVVSGARKGGLESSGVGSDTGDSLVRT